MKTRVKKAAVKRTRKKPMINNIYKSLIIFLTIIYSRIQGSLNVCGIQLILGSKMHRAIPALVPQGMKTRKQSQAFFWLLVP